AHCSIERTGLLNLLPYRSAINNIKIYKDFAQAKLPSLFYFFSLSAFQNWQLSFSRNFRSLKLWFVIRRLGVSKLQGCIRWNNNEMTKELYKMIEEDGRIDLVTAKVAGSSMEEVFCIRIAIVYLFTDEETCDFA
uniref:Uncharacterized protein n=1 Tax=Echinococcus canadensis TaxID=519352 RepID=A0A915EXN9_9CEST